MPANNPRTPREWERYIGTLRGAQLRSKALAAATMDFVKMLQEEGYQAKEISHIYELFARRFVETEQEPPGRVPGGYINYSEVADELGLL